MSSLLRTSLRLPRGSLYGSRLSVVSQRFASSDYGSVQSGHEEAGKDQKPKRDLEHPGPEAPATKGQSSGSSSSSGQNDAPSTDKGEPKIQRPYSAKEKDNPEVRKHNEEMEQRHERSVNQLSEKDNKVDKQFWKGDVGDIKDK